MAGARVTEKAPGTGRRCTKFVELTAANPLSGFAYNPRPKTVAEGGFGVYYDAIAGKTPIALTKEAE